MADDYVIKGRLEIRYDAARTEKQVLDSMSRIRRILGRTGNDLGRSLDMGISRGIKSLVSFERHAGRIGRVAGAELYRGMAKEGFDRIDKHLRGMGRGFGGGGGTGGGGRHWTTGPKGWSAMLGAQLGSGSGLLSSLGGGIGGMVGGPAGAMIGSVVGRTISLGFSPFISALDTATRSLLAMNSSLQQSQYGMASLFSANFGTSFTQSQGIAKGVIRDLRRDAAMGVGDDRQYLQTYQQLMTPALQAGADMGRLRELTRLTVAAGAASGREGGMELASLDILQALSGSASDRTMQVLGPLLRASGVDFGKLNAMGSSDRLAAIEEALRKLAPGAAEMGKTWESRTGALAALLRNFAITGSSRLFERLNAGLGRLNDWLMNNEKRIGRFVGGVGRLFEGLWDFGAQLVAGLMPFVSPFVDDLVAWGGQLRELGATVKRLTGDTTAMKLVGMVLSGFVSQLIGALRVSTGLLEMFVLQLQSMVEPLTVLLDLLSGEWGGVLGGLKQRKQERDRRITDMLGIGWRGQDEGRMGQNRRWGLNLRRGGELQVPMTVNNFNGPIEVKVDTEVNADPSRVAVAWEEAMGKVLRNRRVSRRGGLALQGV